MVGTEIPKSEFDRIIKQAQASYRPQRREFPEDRVARVHRSAATASSAASSSAPSSRSKAEELDIEVTDEEIEKRLDELKKQFFEGDEKYRKEIAKQGLTDEQVRDEIRARVISKALRVRHLVGEGDRRRHQGVLRQEQGAVRTAGVTRCGASSSRTRSAPTTFTRARVGRRLRQARQAVLPGSVVCRLPRPVHRRQGPGASRNSTSSSSMRRRGTSEPVKTQFGYHVIEVLSDVKPKSTTPLKDVEQSIRDTPLRQKQNGACANG